jgi:O-antigen/teichoic acid export membrane protein
MKKEPSESYSHILKYTGMFGGVQGLNLIVGLVRNKLIALLLGPDGMGLASLFNTTVNFVSQVTNLGLPFSAVRHVSELFDAGDEAAVLHFVKVVRSWSLLTALLGILVCFLIGPFLSSSTFAWGDHTLHFILLAPAVGLMAITGGETAILKGARQLRSLAAIQIVLVFVSLLASIPFYYFFGQSAIVPVIVLMAFASMLVTICFSYRFYPLCLKGANGVLGEGMEMMKLGVAFVTAGVLGSGSEMFVRSYLNVVGDLDVVGLYNAGFMLTITYAGIVFSAMEADYFPRLSAVSHNDNIMLSLTINRQIEVSLLLLAPMLAIMVLTLPFLVPLLLSEQFLPMVSMAQIAVFAMYLKTFSLPIAYTNLARGNSLGYLLLEVVYYVTFIALLIWGYYLWGLWGTGLALVLSYVVELFTVYGYVHRRFGYRMSGSLVRCFCAQLSLGAAVYASTFVDPSWLRWTLGGLFTGISMGVSVAILYKKTSLWNALLRKINKDCEKG